MTTPETGLPVFILAGGSAQRFGSDKARAVLLGEPLLRHVAAGLEPIAARVTVVADRADRYADLGFRTLADETPDLGPLGGLSSALLDLRAGEDWLLLAPCDVVGVRLEWLQLLLSARRAGAGAVAFRGEVWQPLPGLYHRAAAAAVRERIASGRRSLWGLMGLVDAEAVPLPAEWQAEVGQINTPEELRAHEARLLGAR
jgi:molybdopterin-guanine dinucleotide biosynthesis protein A